MNYQLICRDRTLQLGPATVVMGILNVTPDSFSGDGVYSDGWKLEQALARANSMIAEGAGIIDVGGESTRPGARLISVEEEIQRVVPVVEALASTTQALISVDTYKPEVALAGLKAGAHMLNLVKGIEPSDEYLSVAREFGAGLVLMHMRGTPQTMQQMTDYRDVVQDVVTELKKSVEKCLRFGLNEHAVAVDPGIGFAKTAEQNIQLLKNLKTFESLNRPILVGTSRKSFIGKVVNADVDQRIFGTAATVACAILNGAHIIRVHDVAAMKQVAQMSDTIKQST